MSIFQSLNRDAVNTVPLIPPSGANGVVTPLLFYVVPDFVSSAMRRAKLNTVDISRFGALSSVLTSEDYANWALEVDQVNRLNIQNISVLEPCVGLEDYWQNVTLDERSYMQREILPLMKFPQRISDVRARLSETREATGAMAGASYSFELMRDGIILHTKPGFMSHIEKGDSDTHLAFVRQLLQKAYSQVPTYEANKRFKNLHRLYIQLLFSQPS